MPMQAQRRESNLNPALRSSEWSVPRSSHFTPGKTRTHAIEGRVGLGAGQDCTESLAPKGLAARTIQFVIEPYRPPAFS
jgi:hypothetical protein